MQVEVLLREMGSALGGGVPGAIKGVLAFLVVVTAAWVAWMIVAGAARQIGEGRGRSEQEALARILFLRPVLMLLGLAGGLQAARLLDVGLAGLGEAFMHLVSAVVWSAALAAAGLLAVAALSARSSPALASALAGIHLRSRRARADGLPQVGDRVEGDGFAGEIAAFGRYHAVLRDGRGNQVLVPLVRLLDQQYRIQEPEAGPPADSAPAPEPAEAAPPPPGFGPPPPPGRLIT